MKVDVLVAEIGSTTTVVNAFKDLDSDHPVFFAQGQAPTSVLEGDVRIAVSNYLSAFIQDINAGRYSQLYSYVQAGSPMESGQKDFIAKSAPQNLSETLLDSQIESL